MKINNLIPDSQRKDITEQFEKYRELIHEIHDTNEDMMQFLTTPGVLQLLDYHIYLESGVLELNDTDVIAMIVTKLLNVFLEEKYGSKETAKNQIHLIWRILNPEMYGIQRIDIKKAFDVIDKKFSATMAQVVRIRRMMLFLSEAVEPIIGKASVLKDLVQMREKPAKIKFQRYRKLQIEPEFYEIQSLDSEGIFLGKQPFEIVNYFFDFLEKDKMNLEDLAIEALMIYDDSFSQKSKKYFKDRIREFIQWEKQTLPKEVLDGIEVSDQKLPFGIKPVIKKVPNERLDEYLILYPFSENWKKRREGSGGRRKKTQK